MTLFSLHPNPKHGSDSNTGKEPMNILKSNDCDQLFEAFVAFHAEIETVVKDKKVNAGKVRYKYADLASLQDYARPLLAKNNLAVTQLVTPDGVASILVHASGQFLGGITAIVMDSTGAKAQGSAITYARRYGYAALLDLAQDDDDGQTADGYAGIQRGKQNPKAEGFLAGAKTGSPSASQGNASASPSDKSSTSSKTSAPAQEGGAEFISRAEALDPNDREGHLGILSEAKNAELPVKDYRQVKAAVTAHYKG